MSITPLLAFEVIGEPKGKGSPDYHGVVRGDGSIVTRANGYPIVVVHEPAESIAWQQAVASVAMAARNRAGVGVLVDVPLAVTMRTYRARNKGHYGTGRNAGLLKPSAPAYPHQRPDADKLARNALDGMTGVVYRDDGQVVDLIVCKRYAEGGDPEGIVVEVAVMDQALPARVLGHADQLALLAA